MTCDPPSVHFLSPHHTLIRATGVIYVLKQPGHLGCEIMLHKTTLHKQSYDESNNKTFFLFASEYKKTMDDNKESSSGLKTFICKARFGVYFTNLHPKNLITILFLKKI